MDDIDDGSRCSSKGHQSELVAFLIYSSEMQKTTRGALQQAGFAGGGALIGALGGPVGSLVGGISGSILGYLKSDDYDNIIVSFQNLTSDQKSVSVH